MFSQDPNYSLVQIFKTNDENQMHVQVNEEYVPMALRKIITPQLEFMGNRIADFIHTGTVGQPMASGPKATIHTVF